MRKLLSLVILFLVCAPAFAADPITPAAPRKSGNFLTDHNGLGAVAAADLGLTIAAMALRGPATWQGFPPGGDNPSFTGGGDPGFADCAGNDGAGIAQALLKEPSVPVKEVPAPTGVIRIDRPEPMASSIEAAGSSLDMNSIYQPGQAFSCPSQ